MKEHPPATATFPLEYLALGLLMGGPGHGYQLYQHYVDTLGPIWLVGRSKFYAVLSDLHKGGYLDATIELQEDYPPRRIYQLTERGRGIFMKWLQQPVTPLRAVRVEFIAKLRFFDTLKLPGAGDLIDAQITVCQRTSQEWQQAASQGTGGGDPFFQIMYDFRQRQAEFIIAWLEKTKQAIETQSK